MYVTRYTGADIPLLKLHSQDEIVSIYKTSRYQRKQLRVLAQLNNVPERYIAQILYDSGISTPYISTYLHKGIRKKIPGNAIDDICEKMQYKSISDIAQIYEVDKSTMYRYIKLNLNRRR